jgi:hypothetical protein
MSRELPGYGRYHWKRGIRPGIIEEREQEKVIMGFSRRSLKGSFGIAELEGEAQL